MAHLELTVFFLFFPCWRGASHYYLGVLFLYCRTPFPVPRRNSGRTRERKPSDLGTRKYSSSSRYIFIPGSKRDSETIPGVRNAPYLGMTYPYGYTMMLPRCGTTKRAKGIPEKGFSRETTGKYSGILPMPEHRQDTDTGKVDRGCRYFVRKL